MMQENFFEMNFKRNSEKQAPLAVRMRPTHLNEILGQQHIIGEGKLLNRLIMADRLSSVVFYGPPGTGKTTLAHVIAHHTQAAFYELNAVSSGKKEIIDIIEKARNNLSMHERKTILFIDEIHRFNKAQQDALLPSVEKGVIILIGATTENPYFEINSPLLSRSTVFEFLPITEEDIFRLLLRAANDEQKGLGNLFLNIDEKALRHFASAANGDVRKALNALELAALTADKNDAGEIEISFEVAQECIQVKALKYDKTGDNHYDTVSAFIKSIRGSDPDAALFWLAKMIHAGEDPKFIARRLVISASEDIGNAQPLALVVAVSAARAVEMIGLPEARINLAQATAFLASSPKSNASICGIDDAMDAVLKRSQGIVPLHLRDAHYSGSKKMGRGIEYKYPHNYENNYCPQQYLPDDLLGEQFYYPTMNGAERKLAAYLQMIADMDQDRLKKG